MDLENYDAINNFYEADSKTVKYDQAYLNHSLTAREILSFKNNINPRDNIFDHNSNHNFIQKFFNNYNEKILILLKTK